MKLIKVMFLVITMCCSNVVLAKQSNKSFEVVFQVLPTCSIKTDKIIDSEYNLKIISNCSHEDYYITTSNIDKKRDIYNYNVSESYNISRVKNIDNNEVHALVHNLNLQKENTLITINF